MGGGTINKNDRNGDFYKKQDIISKHTFNGCEIVLYDFC